MKTILVGAGPRSLILAERLISNYEHEASQDTLSIQLIDPYAIGGRVWRVDQNPLFLMNSAIQQLTFFTDDAVTMAGPVHNGPNFYEWVQTQAPTYLTTHIDQPNAKYFLDHLADLTLNSYPSRGLLNFYANWFYEQLQARAQAVGIELTYTQAEVTDIQNNQPPYNVITDKGTFLADRIVMALGHSSNRPTPEEAQLAKFADEHALRYIKAQHPAEADLNVIPAGEDVVIRGLGLNFFDYMIQLTIHRGGHFEPTAAGTLRYHPSGLEPHIIAGSRSGLPLHAKGINQKTQGTRYRTHFLTEAKLAELTDNGQHPVAYETFKALFVAEMEYVYYTNLAKERGIASDDLAAALVASTNLNATALAFGFKPADLFDLQKVIHPFGNEDNITSEYETLIERYLAFDIEDSGKGNLDAPLTAAFDLIRDIRDNIRILIEGNGFSNDDRKKFLTEFNALSSLISVGPPRLRIQQMLALIEAGVLEVAPAGLQVGITEDKFFVSTDNPNYQYIVTNLVEARLGAIDLHRSTNPLEENLRDRGTMTSASYLLADQSVYSTGALIVDRKNFELITSTGQHMTDLHAYGVPTEKYMWFTTSLPRPYGNDRMLRDADNIARTILAGVKVC
ncbi:FAD/NAD(P)-binding protein [Periweissella fabalis]|uniref:FAD-dependent urate hydroxylase HpyO/Asp monooxygenase CreE-like FAD/NAD(P)-binding domain-containing protein n=1 Tax=Periweissella fabalis TaxID=1070421 RepID=A0A7X6N2L8_9LACO|nr:FAD/NAD(P)-binding protein [Periweissella fabalis]MCM0598407.1 FAD/NAD(P)-binding protein [Periweissella fabalis]NKZ23970.1 hypothetical protein [Periweissella fabalis]